MSASDVRQLEGLRFGRAKLATGPRLHYAEYGRPGGRAILLLHGYSDSWFSFRPMLPFVPPDVHVLALDHRGHGDSESPPSGYSIPQLAADAVALLDAKGLDRATLVGHSLGALVAQQAAVAAPERVERLLLIGTAARTRHLAAMEELRQAVEALRDPVPIEFIREFQESTLHRSVPPEFLARVVEESRMLTADVWRAVMQGILGAEPPAGLAASRIPTWILWGERDAVFPASEQEALRALLPEAVWKLYPDTGHAVHWEHPEKVARDLESLLNGKA